MKLTPELVSGFVKAFLLDRFDSPVATPKFHYDLWSLYCSDNQHVAIAAPRGCAKSTAGTVSYGMASLLFGESRHLLIVSATESQAVAFLSNMATEFTSNEKLIEAFAINQPLVKHAATELIVSVGADKREFRIIAKGASQKLRGIIWSHARPDLVLIDDIEDDDTVLNSERRSKFKSWFLGALLPCASKTGRFRMAGTVLHNDSLLENLLPKKTRDYPLVVEDLVEYSDDPLPMWRGARFKAHNSDYSKLLWAEQLSEKKLKGLQRMFEDLGDPDSYYQEFLNIPINEKSAFFQREYLQPMLDADHEQNKNKVLKYYVGADFAISQKTKSDYTVLSIIGVDTTGCFHLVDVRRGRWDTYTIVEEMLAIQSMYKPQVFFVENGQIWLAIEPVLLKTMHEPGSPRIAYKAIAPVSDKIVRARPLQHRTRAGMIRFNDRAPWYEDWESEIMRFPRAAHDDRVDSLSVICKEVLSIGKADTQEQVIKRERAKADKKRRDRKKLGSVAFSSKIGMGGY